MSWGPSIEHMGLWGHFIFKLPQLARTIPSQVFTFPVCRLHTGCGYKKMREASLALEVSRLEKKQFQDSEGYCVVGVGFVGS